MTCSPRNLQAPRTAGRRRRPTHLGATCGVVCLCLGVWTDPAAAQRATVPNLKAAFLSNFAKFTEWPADALGSGQSLTLCVLGDAFIAVALERTINGRHHEGHELAV